MERCVSENADTGRTVGPKLTSQIVLLVPIRVTPTWVTWRRVAAVLVALALLVVLSFPRAAISEEIAAIGALVGSAAVILWGLTFWRKGRIQIGRLNLRHKIVRRNAGAVALIALSFLGLRAVSLHLMSSPEKAANAPAVERVPAASATGDLAGGTIPKTVATDLTQEARESLCQRSATPTAVPASEFVKDFARRFGITESQADELLSRAGTEWVAKKYDCRDGKAEPHSAEWSAQDLELLRSFCSENRDASTTVFDFLRTDDRTDLALRYAPENASKTLAEFCQPFVHIEDHPLYPFCVGALRDPDTERLTIAEYLKLHDRLMDAFRRVVGGPPEDPTALDRGMTLPDLCRKVGL